MTRKRELYSSAIRSRTMIREALLELMGEKVFTDISISEIMKRADLVRRTFYAHYKSKEEVLSKYIDELIESSMNEILNGVQECNGTMALVYFRLWNNHKKFIKLLQDSDQLILLNNFYKYIDKYNEEQAYFEKNNYGKLIGKYASIFYAGAMWNVLTQWIMTGMEETPDELSDVLDELFSISNQYSQNQRII